MLLGPFFLSALSILNGSPEYFLLLHVPQHLVLLPQNQKPSALSLLPHSFFVVWPLFIFHLCFFSRSVFLQNQVYRCDVRVNVLYLRIKDHATDFFFTRLGVVFFSILLSRGCVFLCEIIYFIFLVPYI
uniref:Uncharacterized protein n=1 Tax=Cacopsylla melanoneura TaxID=428564 RepID=A0A8D8QFN2_9HEMI